MKCPECHASFEWDDRLESLFVDLNDLRLPVSGTVCPARDLLQSEENKKCAYCEKRYCDDPWACVVVVGFGTIINAFLKTQKDFPGCRIPEHLRSL